MQQQQQQHIIVGCKYNIIIHKQNSQICLYARLFYRKEISNYFYLIFTFEISSLNSDWRALVYHG